MTAAGTPVPAGPELGVVIPAHDEAGVIGRCLAALLTDAEPGEFDIVVVANGCRDDTASVARSYGVRVIETDQQGKAHALRLGDAALHSFPRAYLDADIELTAPQLRDLASALSRSGRPACAPLPDLDLTGVSRIAAGAHRASEQLVADRRGLFGAGVYLLDERGHEQVFPIPDILADDCYVHRCFKPDEILVATDIRTTVRPAKTLPATVRHRARTRSGNRQLSRAGRSGHERPVGLGALLRSTVRRNVTVSDGACLIVVVLCQRFLCALRRLRGTSATWSTDRTSRTTAAVSE